MTDIQKMIEEEARTYAEEKWNIHTCNYLTTPISLMVREVTDGFQHGANFVLHANRWRKVSDELPPNYQDVIFKVNVFAKTYHAEMTSIGHIIVNGGFKLQIDLLARDIIEYQITEWKPIY